MNSVVEEIMKKEPLITSTKVDKVKELIESMNLNGFFVVVIFCFILRITRKNISSRR